MRRLGTRMESWSWCELRHVIAMESEDRLNDEVQACVGL